MIEFNKYQDLILYFQQNIPVGIYTEKHHIIPKFEGGTNEKENLIILPFEYHVLAHFLMYKESTSEKSKNLNLLACQLIINQPKVNREEDLKKLIFDEVYIKSVEEIRKNINKAHRIRINKDGKEKSIFQEDLEKYLNDGWEKGRVPEAKEWASKGHAKMVETKKKNGTFSGFHLTDEHKRKVSEGTKKGMERARKEGKQIGRLHGSVPSTKGQISITNGEINKYIDKDSPIPEGWWIGSTQKHFSQTKGGCYHINNGVVRKSIKKEELEEYLALGWKRGDLKKPRTWINNGKVNKYIDNSKLEDFLKDGWVLGKLS